MFENSLSLLIALALCIVPGAFLQPLWRIMRDKNTFSVSYSTKSREEGSDPSHNV